MYDPYKTCLKTALISEAINSTDRLTTQYSARLGPVVGLIVAKKVWEPLK